MQMINFQSMMVKLK